MQCVDFVELFYHLPPGVTDAKDLVGPMLSNNYGKVVNSPVMPAGTVAIFQPGSYPGGWTASSSGHVAVVMNTPPPNGATMTIAEANMNESGKIDVRTIPNPYGTNGAIFILPYDSYRTTGFQSEMTQYGANSGTIVSNPGGGDQGFLGIPGAISGAVMTFVTFMTKGGEVLFGLLLIALGSYVIFKYAASQTGGKNVIQIVNDGRKVVVRSAAHPVKSTGKAATAVKTAAEVAE